MKTTRILIVIVGILLLAPIVWTGCSSDSTMLFIFHPIDQMFVSHSNPIEGWKPVAQVDCKIGEMSAEITPIPGYEAISDDVQKFVNKLPVDDGPDYAPGSRRWCYWMTDMTFYEDGTGKHAVGFEIPHGEVWGYVLVYDKNNKRVKASRYIKHYQFSM